MDVNLVLKIAGIGILVFAANQVLKSAGRDDQAVLVNISGIVIALILLVGEISRLFTAVRTAFGF